MPTARIVTGTVSAAGTVDPKNIALNDDGSFSISILVALNSAQRIRVNKISADGLTFWLDGVLVGSPPQALLDLGAALVAALPKITAVYTLPAIQTALTAP